MLRGGLVRCRQDGRSSEGRCQRLLTHVLAPASSPVREPNLDSGLGQASLLSQFFASVHVRVLGAFEGALQLFELFRRESRPRSADFPLQKNSRLGIAVGFFLVIVDR